MQVPRFRPDSEADFCSLYRIQKASGSSKKVSCVRVGVCQFSLIRHHLMKAVHTLGYYELNSGREGEARASHGPVRYV